MRNAAGPRVRKRIPMVRPGSRAGMRDTLRPAESARQSPPPFGRGRKVRTPQGRVMANGHPSRDAEQGNREQTADGP